MPMATDQKVGGSSPSERAESVQVKRADRARGTSSTTVVSAVCQHASGAVLFGRFDGSLHNLPEGMLLASVVLTPGSGLGWELVDRPEFH